MSNIGWNLKAGGAEQPIQPTPPTQIAANNHPPNQPPPSYNSIYPQIPNPIAPSAPYVLQPVQNNMQIPGPGTSTIQSTISPQMQNIISHGQSLLPQQLQDAAAQVQTAISSTLSGNPFWLPASEGQVPPGAVVGGHEVGGEKLYVARARHGGALIPGKLVPSHRCCYVPWGGREHSVKHYEVLCNCSGTWISASRGNYSPHALPGGTSEKGETLYIGRANHKGSQTIGKIQPSHKLCYIPYAGKEIGYKSYEVFVPNN
ncbi:uncharacterized protein LOC129808322 isoform X2 [Phlebotomus papatasi]|uniref:uncharacterized protein LOC129808322 isoform X2 n=1 Tax=Phlebotomus papatasi TaxID=29031 RepID=UPI0024841423|nr:uncharacterized protein LOC129808322 isoform X2 [Phlebotomus papatasi]